MTSDPNSHPPKEDTVTTLHQTFIDTPIGKLRLVADAQALVAVDLPSSKGKREPALDAPAAGHPVLDRARAQMAAYFAGERRSFDVPLAPRGTAFQRSVWAALNEIPCGETRSYRDIAARIGRPSSTRAVGAANGQNPIAVIIPCHRVIGADGSLTGYGGGLPTKRWLLEHELRP
jgi:methylated-DNA-[protein]-cysteine S-methyltransferase